MGRDLRYLPRSGQLVEITQRTFQGRYLLRPSRRFNALVVGCLAKARKNTGATVHAVVFMSSHLHLLCSFDSVEQMATFMCQLKTSLSIEIGHRHDWPGASWGHRYHSIPVSDEPAAQQNRLGYLLRQEGTSYCTSCVIPLTGFIIRLEILTNLVDGSIRSGGRILV